MSKYYYDLHIHSCLSPCGDDDMTPNNIVNMAMLNELNIIALTDHNSTDNCEAAMTVAEEAGIILIPGMELTTSEEIHVVCLFPNILCAKEFNKCVYDTIPNIDNAISIYGNQFIMDSKDNVIGNQRKLLIVATSIGLYEVQSLVQKYKGVAILAHIDRHSNGVLGILGNIEQDMGFKLAEVSKNANPKDYKTKFEFLNFVNDSDAHSLVNIAEASEHSFFEGNFSNAEEVVNFLKNY